MRRRSLTADSAGSMVIEFALAAPLVLLLAILTFEIGHRLTVQSTLDNAVREAARFTITGAAAPEGMTRDAQIRQIILDYGASVLKSAQLSTDILSYASFADIGKPETFTDLNGNGGWDEGEPYIDANGNNRWDADRGAAGAGDSGQVVIYRVRYTEPPLTDLAAGLLTNPMYRYETRIVVRNEPF